MDSEKARRIFVWSLDTYFQELINLVDQINPSSKARNLIADFHAVLKAAATNTLLASVPRSAGKHKELVAPGTDFFYRICSLTPGGPKELVAMLAVDLNALPETDRNSINAYIGSASVSLEAVRVLSFVLTRGSGAAYQRVMLVAAKDAAGSLVAVPWPPQWSVSGKVVGACVEGLNAEEEERLNYLLYLVLDQDAATMHSAKRDGPAPLH